MKKKPSRTVGSITEYVAVNRKLSRQEEFERLGPGFHSRTTAHKSRKQYDRKAENRKWKHEASGDGFHFFMSYTEKIA